MFTEFGGGTRAPFPNSGWKSSLTEESGWFDLSTISKTRLTLTSNGNRTEWSPIRSVIIRVITKSDDRAAGVRFVYHEYDYRQNWTTRSLITN